MLNNESLISFLKTKQLLKVEETIYLNGLKKLINRKNIFCLLGVCNTFSLKELKVFLISILKNYFDSFSKTNEFNDLSYTTFKNIVSSSELKLSSEIEVFEAIVSWVKYDKKNRKYLMYDLLMNVRLHLLSSEIVENVIKRNKFCLRSNKCCNYIESILMKQPESIKDLSKKLPNRCCMNEHTSFVILDKNDEQRIFMRPEKSFSLNLFDPQYNGVHLNRLTAASSAFYYISNYDINLFSSETNEWSPETPDVSLPDYYDELNDFAACLFMGNLYVTGGRYLRRDIESSCAYKFDTKTNEWNELASMRQARSCHSCVVFGGKIVVAGGCENLLVDAYDHYKDKWALMAELNRSKARHGSVAMGNKLYVVGYWFLGWRDYTPDCEVFDYISNKFTVISPIPLEYTSNKFEVFRVQNKIVVKFDGEEMDDNFYIYNTADDKWTSMSVELFKEKPAKLLHF